MIVWKDDPCLPMYEIKLQCKACNAEAVAMTSGEDSVQWCEKGHLIKLTRDQQVLQFHIMQEF